MKRKVVAFDFETIPNLSMLHLLPEVKPKGNLKDPVKIAEDIAEKQEKQREEMGLNPLFNIICCAGFCDENGTFSIVLEDEDSEADLLIKTWEKLAKYDQFVSFNGRNFDMRCLLLHNVKHGIRSTVDIHSGRYNAGNHIDMRQVFSGTDQFAPGNLELYASIFLDDHKTEGIDGKMVADWWAFGDKQAIAEYCEKDCKLTYELFIQAAKCGLIEGF